MEKSTKWRKGDEFQPIDICVEAKVEAYGEPTLEKGVILTGKKVYRHQLTSTYKETESSEDLKNDM